jgi:DNA polymerase (family 10)
LVREKTDLTAFPGIGDAIAACIREIDTTGTLGKLDKLRAGASPLLAGISQYPRLDPKRVLRVSKKLGIESIEDLKERLEGGEIDKVLGLRMAQHIRQGLTETHAMLLYRADDLRVSIEEFLLGRCGVRRAEAVGDYRRRVEVIEEISFVVDTERFTSTVETFSRFSGRTPLVTSANHEAVFALSAGILVRLHATSQDNWGLCLIASTSSGPATNSIWDASSSMPGNRDVSSRSIQARTGSTLRRRMRAAVQGVQKLPYRPTRTARGSSVWYVTGSIRRAARSSPRAMC